MTPEAEIAFFREEQKEIANRIIAMEFILRAVLHSSAVTKEQVVAAIVRHRWSAKPGQFEFVMACIDDFFAPAAPSGRRQ